MQRNVNATGSGSIRFPISENLVNLKKTRNIKKLKFKIFVVLRLMIDLKTQSDFQA